METIIAALNEEITRLTQARAMLMGEFKCNPKPARVTVMHHPKRVISPEGRARIAAAQKLRWAKSRKVA